MEIFQKLLIFLLVNVVLCHNKYSKEANAPDISTENLDFRPHYVQHLEKPFRMSKLNLLWSKAVVRLSEPKLKSLLSELKLHDKLEIAYKHENAHGKNKDGLKEEDLRQKLKKIMLNYNLLDQIDSIDDPKNASGHEAMNSPSKQYVNKSLFRDKKLSKLWEKAEHSGFTAEELETLKEEFLHHQNKVDQYYELLHDVKKNEDDRAHENSVDEKLDKFNEIDRAEEDSKLNKDYLDKANLIREQGKVIKEGYDNLARLTAKGPSNREFVEPKVQGLWKIAVESNFSPDELESLKVELLHYENRLLKLRHLQVEQAINEQKFNTHKAALGSKQGDESLVKDQIKKHARKIEKMHSDIESRILERHGEL